MKLLIGIGVSLVLIFGTITLLVVLQNKAPDQKDSTPGRVENTTAWRDAKIKELQTLKDNYYEAPVEARGPLANIMRYKANGIPRDTMPEDLQKFFHDVTSPTEYTTPTTAKAK